MIKSIIRIILFFICLLAFYSYSSKSFVHSLNKTLKNNKLITINQNLNKKKVNAYIDKDTLYVISISDSLKIKRYLKLYKNHLGVEMKYAIEQERREGYLFVSLYYYGDATPFKSFLVNLKLKSIIIENEFYQDYLGCSDNGIYHLFEGGTSASAKDFAIFSSDNKLLLESSYYLMVNDTYQLKWTGNKVYYYSNPQKGNMPPPNGNQDSNGLYLIYVQKYMWEENHNYILNEFTEAFIE